MLALALPDMFFVAAHVAILSASAIYRAPNSSAGCWLAKVSIILAAAISWPRESEP